MAISLTDRQAIAAASARPFTNIESAPGSGKTTVAAERIGYLARTRSTDPRGILGLSFTRAAVGELASRVGTRWGLRMLGIPNLVTTFDDLHVRILQHLLTLGLIRWPSGHLKLTVLDEYRGIAGFRFRPAGSFKRSAACDSSTSMVSSNGRKVTKNEFGFGSKNDHETALKAGYCSHEDVRSVLRSAIDSRPKVAKAIGEWMTSNFRHIVIDEIYDADELDLWTATSAGLNGTEITVVGDPWQALYGWRGATPEKVQGMFDSLSFYRYEQPESFRFRGEQMPSLARQLRNGEPVALARNTSEGVDVALSRRWSDLWSSGDNVLPLAFRTIQNATDAMLNLLLDEVTRRKLGTDSFGKQTALIYLRLEPTYVASVQSAVFEPVVRALLEGVNASNVLKLLRDAAETLGVARRPSRLANESELKRVGEIESLRSRIRRNDLVPGMTVHQAKGRQWSRVGVILTAEDERVLSNGLKQLVEDHCVLYVALTRAQDSCIALVSPHELPLEHLT